MSEKYNIPESNSLDSMEGVDNHNKNMVKDIENLQGKTKIVPVEKLIPGISQDFKMETNIENGNSFDTSFSEEFYNKFIYVTTHKKSLEVFRNRLKDQILVELGPGYNAVGYNLAVIGGCNGYIGVEKYFHKQLKEGLDGLTKEKQKKYFEQLHFFEAKDGNICPDFDMIPASVVPGDMLAFLKSLPDNSVSIYASGIDAFVLPDDKYRKELALEIERVLSKDGVYITNASDIETKLRPLVDTLSPENSDRVTKSNLELGGRSEILIKD